jgi:hypothetical protein
MKLALDALASGDTLAAQKAMRDAANALHEAARGAGK